MFSFIKNFFLKSKSKKILSYIEKIETLLTLFQNIDRKCFVEKGICDN